MRALQGCQLVVLGKLFIPPALSAFLRLLLGCLRQDARPETKVLFVNPGN